MAKECGHERLPIPHHCSIVTFLLLARSAEAVEFAGGTGEPNDPYQIATAEQLMAMGQDEGLQGRHFALVADIDMDPNLPGGVVLTSGLVLAGGAWMVAATESFTSAAVYSSSTPQGLGERLITASVCSISSAPMLS